MVKTRDSSRGKIDIIADILDISTAGTRKTRIMSMARLTYNQTAGYLQELQERRFIEQVMENGETFYRITQTGRNFLESYGKLMQILHLAEPKPVHELYR